jgi:hypothetical protein
VEVKREQLGGAPGPDEAAGSSPYVNPAGLRVRQLNARQLLRGGEIEGPTPAIELERNEDFDLERHVEERVLTTTLDKAVAWARSNSFFPATFGLACCAIEMMSIVAARVDVARFGFEAFRASPRQADLLILSGRVSIKMAPIVRRIYDQMLEPKFDLDGRVLLVDGRLQQLLARARRQVHAGRRARTRLSTAPGGTDARRAQAAQDGAGRSRHGLA